MSVASFEQLLQHFDKGLVAVRLENVRWQSFTVKCLWTQDFTQIQTYSYECMTIHSLPFETLVDYSQDYIVLPSSFNVR